MYAFTYFRNVSVYIKLYSCVKESRYLSLISFITHIYTQYIFMYIFAVFFPSLSVM